MDPRVPKYGSLLKDAIDMVSTAWPMTPAARAIVLILSALVLLLTSLIGWAVYLRLRRKRAESRVDALENRWEPVLERVITRRQPFWALDDAVDVEDITDFLSFLHRRAVSATPAQLKWIRVVARPYLSLAPASLAARTAEQRAFRVHQLGWLGPPEADATLRAALNDRSSFVAMVALRALIRRRTARRAELSEPDKVEFARSVVTRVPRFKDWRQTSLAAMLARVEEIAPPLRRLLASTRSPMWVRGLAAATLKQLDDTAAAPIAARMLRRERARPLHTAALRLLESVGDSRHVPLLRRLCTSNDEVIRIRALSTLAHVGDANDVPVFERALDDSSRWVARQAAFGLVRLGHPQALHALADSAHPRASLAIHVLSRQRRAA